MGNAFISSVSVVLRRWFRRVTQTCRRNSAPPQQHQSHKMTSDSWLNVDFEAERSVCRCCSRKSGTFSFIYCDKSAVVFSRGNSTLRLLTGWRIRGCDIQTDKTFFVQQTPSSSALVKWAPRQLRLGLAAAAAACVCVCSCVLCRSAPLFGTILLL